MSRIEQKFTSLKKEKRAGLITYVMAFDPDEKRSFAILESLPEAGADIIELGMPFSDPMADGPVIQAAGVRALKSGAKLKTILAMVKKFRAKNNETPIVLMGYYNPIYNYGLAKFSKDAKDAGVDGLLIVDLPPEEDEELYSETQKQQLDLIKLVTPTTDEKRLPQIIKKASGFIYYVAVAGVTGTKSASYDSIEKSVKLINKHSNIPVAVGFGVKSPEDVKNIAKHADAVVVGSAIVKIVEENQNNPAEKVGNFVKKLSI